MEDDSSLIKFWFNLGACAIVAIGYFERPDDASFWYYLRLSLWAVGVAVVGHLLSAWDERRTQCRRDKRAAKILKRLKADPARVQTPYFVYLRPFFTTGNMPIERRRGGLLSAIPFFPAYFEDRIESRSVELEKTLSKALVCSGLLIGLGKPGEQIGAGRIATDDATWQDDVRLLVQHAKYLLLIPSERPGTSWEVNLTRDGGYLDKCVFLMPPKLYFSSIDIEDAWSRTRESLKKDGVDLPEYQSSGAMFKLNASGKPQNKQPLPLDSERQLLVNVDKLLKQ